MSRIGNKPIAIVDGVEVKVNGNEVTVKGAKGTLNYTFNSDITVAVEGNEVIVTRPSDVKEHRALHGLTRTLIANMIEGVSKGFVKELEVNGVGYRVAKQGKDLVMNLGYSHQVILEEVPGITVEVPAPDAIIVKGIEKDKVGQFAADIRSKRPPEPYKGKGVRYAGEVIILKEGKSGKK